MRPAVAGPADAGILQKKCQQPTLRTWREVRDCLGPDIVINTYSYLVGMNSELSH